MGKNKAGYTFIEIMIAVAVIAVLSGISLASYGKFNQRKKLDNEVEQFKQTFEIAKKKAIATDKSGLLVGATDYASCDLAGYKINITSSTAYSLAVNVCDNTGACPLSSGCTDITLSNYTLQSPITINPTGTLQFDPTTKTVSGLLGVTLTNSTLNQSTILTIDKSGIIF